MEENKKDIRKWSVYVHIVPKELSGYEWDKYYVGLTSNVKVRWHGNGSGYKRCPLFYKAINKYGWNNIKHEILYYNLTKEEANILEIETISKLNATDKRFGYNISRGGQGNKRLPQKVAQYDRDGNLICTYISCSEAENKLNISGIRHGALKENVLVGNYLWRYYEDIPLEKVPPYTNFWTRIVLQYSLSGEFIKEWRNLQELSKIYNKESVIHCCNGYLYETSGYQWRYKDSILQVEDLTYKKGVLKPVYVYSIEGEYIGKFKNASEAGRYLKIPKKLSLTDVLNGNIRRNKAYGYRWSWVYYESLPPLYSDKKPKKPFVQIDTKTNTILYIFSNKQEAADKGFSQNSVRNAIKNNTTYKGYKWKLLKDIKESEISDSFLLEKYKEMLY